jgi:phospholipid/cholesterol/gamma-HCH transport system substrate-binding protein
MANVTQAAKVGIFFVLTGAAAYGLYRSVGGATKGNEGYVVHGYIRDATGLANHSRVTIAGIPVGTIDDIRLEEGRARIDVRVKKDVALFDNATIGKKSASLLGESIIVLTAGTPDTRKLANGDEVKTIVESATMEQILNDVARIADRIKLVADQLANALGTQQGGDNLKRILQNVADATEALNGAVRENRSEFKQIVSNVERITTRSEPEVAKILDNIRVITADLKELMAAQNDKTGAKTGDLRSTIEKVNRASSSLESALSHADSVAARIDRGEGTIGKLTKDDALINEVQNVTENIGDLVGGITRVQTVVGLRSDYNFLAGTIKSYVELRIQPREDKYYVIELINDPRGRTTFEQTDIETTNPNEPSSYRTVKTTTTDAFRISIQYARRLGPFTGRFGIKESTGGLGLDIHLFRDRFEMVNDVFGFGESLRPRYRLALGYQFLNGLWLMGGMDHIFVSDRRDYFLGLQLRFTDEDLKSILPFAGGSFTGGR